jgi:endonuclease/exonuclease/phosphatase family metal-dependent hydrolase
MRITAGTFNLNNLFSRFNFEAELDGDGTQPGSGEMASSVIYTFTDSTVIRLRTFQGRLVKGKTAEARGRIAERILRMNLDVLAVQEVENIDILQQFVREDLGGLYPNVILVEGNDPRMIDLGLLSKLPIGGITSWQRAAHAADPGTLVFGRDLLEVEILSPDHRKRLFTVFNNHLKSHFVPADEDPITGAQRANERRQRQAEVVTEIVERRTRPDGRYVILGDMNDPVDSLWLSPLVQSPALKLVDGLANPIETRPPKPDNPMPATAAWSYRHKEPGQPALYTLFDHIWLSPALAAHQTGAWIDRRKRHGGDGSDHDPTWVELDFS